MCGLSALFAASGADLGQLIRTMTDVVRHRGPDDEGYALFAPEPLVLGGRDTPQDAIGLPLAYCPADRSNAPPRGWVAALGHRRLSIVDLAPTGHQPMCLPDRGYWIIYNGEVYNHVELRFEIEKAGVRLASRSDTEVILAAYRLWGERCLERFNGMFAFVLYDWRARRIFAARDRFGVKPLYYWTSPSGLVAFASEIKQFTVLPGWRPEVNGQRAYDFVNWGVFDHTAETLFRGAYQLRGGEYVSAGIEELCQGVRPQRWYAPAPRRSNGSEAAATYRALLEDSVRLRLRADVPVGSCLSGGLDSSAIVCLARRQLREAGAEALQKTFSARSTDPRVDEGRYIDAVVRSTGVTNFQVEPAFDGLFTQLPQITWHQDEPFGSTSIYAQWHVFALAAAKDVKVMLDGQGADEQLGGYIPFLSSRFANLASHGRLLALLADVRGARRLHRLPWLQLIAYAASPFVPEAARQPLRLLFGRASARPAFMDLDRLGAFPRDPFADCGAKARSVVQLSLAQILHTSLPMLLHWEDRDSMAHSIEARVPFLDYRLVEFALGLPEEHKLDRGLTKRVLRDAMRGVLPEEVRARTDKIGFATAEEQWLRQRPDDFRAAMRAAVDASQGILRPSALQLLEDVIAGRRAFSQLPWRMISFGAWMQRFDAKLA